MDTMEVNKLCAAVLVAGIAFFLTGLIGTILVHEKPLKESAIKIEGLPAAPASGQPQQEQLPPIAPLLAQADPAKGEAAAKRLCSACHTFNQGGANGVGPNLYGVVGAPHGHVQGFNFSSALKSKEGPWTFPELNQWLHKPSSYAPGTRMSFAGINNAQDRANVIDYLRTLSPNPMPLPEPTAQQPAAGGQQPAAGGQQQPAAGGQQQPAAGGQQQPAAGGQQPAAGGQQPAR